MGRTCVLLGVLVAWVAVAHADSTTADDLAADLTCARVHVDQAAELVSGELDLTKRTHADVLLTKIREAKSYLSNAEARIRAAFGEPTYGARLATSPKWVDETKYERRMVRKVGPVLRDWPTGNGWVKFKVAVTAERLLQPALALKVHVGLKGTKWEGVDLMHQPGSKMVEQGCTWREEVAVFISSKTPEMQWLREVPKSKLAPLLEIRHAWVLYEDGTEIGYQR